MKRTIKTRRHAELIAAGLNKTCQGSSNRAGDNYLDGYDRRRLIETDAKKSIAEYNKRIF